MFTNYLKIAVRSLWRQRGHTTINLSGLVLGIGSAILVGMFVANELSYDSQYDGDDVYRIVRDIEREDGTRHTARSPVPMGETLAQDFPEIVAASRFWRAFQATLKTEDNSSAEPGLYFADKAAFEVFPVEFLQGDPATALAVPGSIVVTESMARRYFGEEDPMGQTFTYDGYPGEDGSLYTVTAVLADLPENTHLAFSALASIVDVETEGDNWGSNKPIWTYVRMGSNTDPETLQSKLPPFVEQYMGASVGRTQSQVMLLQPVRDIHFSSLYTQGFKPGASRSFLMLFAAIGGFILLLACVNFINLSTASSMKRAREIGMRKVLGAARIQLVRQFLGEALLMALIAGSLGLTLAELFLPSFNEMFGTSLSISFAQTPMIFLAVPLLAVATGLLAGLYPALLLSRFKPTAAISAQAAAGRGSVRKGLVVFQFAISAALMVGTVSVKKQLDYARSMDLGITQDQVLVVPFSPSAKPIMEALAAYPRIHASSVSQRVPVNQINGDTRPVLPEGFENSLSTESYIVDDQFAETFGLELAAGRFLTERSGETPEFVINEAAVERFGWGSAVDAIGKEVSWTNGPRVGPVIGVVKDFHLASIHEVIPPLVMQYRPEGMFWRTFISFRISSDNVAETLALVEETWKAQTPDGAYSYFFVDESFEALHAADTRFGRIVNTFSGIALFIACLGLFGLAAFTTERRTKEVGIRKALGATVSSIVNQLSKEYTGLVAVAFLIGAPVSYVLMNQWLERFAYRIELSWSIFAFAGGVTLLMALLAVGYHALRSARANPIESLRSE